MSKKTLVPRTCLGGRLAICVVAVCAHVLSLGSPVAASATTFKIAFWNIKSGKGQIALPGHRIAADQGYSSARSGVFARAPVKCDWRRPRMRSTPHLVLTPRERDVVRG